MIALNGWKTAPAKPLETVVPLNLCRGLAAREVDRRIALASRAGDVSARVLAFYLLDLAERRAYQELGFHSIEQYAETRYGMQPSTTREYLSVGRRLEELPSIDEAIRDGRLGWSKVRVIVRVATLETELDWIEFAVTHTVRQLETQARLHRAGERPSDPTRRRIHDPAFEAHGKFGLLQAQVWNNARAKLEVAFGRHVSDSELMIEGASSILRHPVEGDGAARGPVNDSHFKVMVHCEKATGRTTIETADGPVELDPPTAAAILREAGRDDLACWVDPNTGPEVPPEERDQPVSAAQRLAILARDGYRCRCCGSKLNLTIHHIIWLLFGGRSVDDNLLTTCEDCHSLVHARLLFIRGSVRNGLKFTDADGRELADAGDPGLRIDDGRLKSWLNWMRPSDDARASGDDARASGMAEAEPGELPESVDAEWWTAHEPMLSWNDRQGTLELTTEVDARAAASDARVDARASGSRGLADLVGQERAARNLKRAVEAARKLGQPPPHILLAGPAGLGKTSLAEAVAADMGSQLHRTSGPVIAEPGLLLRLLTTLKDGDILFLDEIHRLPARIAELLYEAMEQGALSLPVRANGRQRTLHVRLRRFCLIGATSEENLIPAPFRSRFKIREHLEYYASADVARILELAATGLGLHLEPQAGGALASAARGTPREALSLLRCVHDEAVIRGTIRIDGELVESVLESLGIDAMGLRANERQYLAVLRRAGRPVGLATLAGRLGETRQTVRQVHEPYLLRLGLITMTPTGRSLTG